MRHATPSGSENGDCDVWFVYVVSRIVRSIVLMLSTSVDLICIGELRPECVQPLVFDL